MVTIESSIDDHILQRLGILGEGLKAIALPLEMEKLATNEAGSVLCVHILARLPPLEDEAPDFEEVLEVDERQAGPDAVGAGG